MADEDRVPRVSVATSTRMPHPGNPDDTMHGKRFVHPETGEPVSMVDLLGSLGFVRPAIPSDDRDRTATGGSGEREEPAITPGEGTAT